MPFDIQVMSFLQNSALRDVRPDDKNPATTGAGTRLFAEAKRAAAGADSDSKVNLASVYVKLLDKRDGHSLGEYLFNQELKPQTVRVDGKKYDVELRFKREYEPYAVHLDNVTMTPYEGTTIPHDYRSEVRLVDEDTGLVHSFAIWMNHPVRYHGETFYQSGYDASSGKEVTVLSVVSNAGWMTPYVACMLVVVGMVAHFSLLLGRFLDSRAAKPAVAPATSHRELAGWALPIAVVAIMACWVTVKARVPPLAAGAMNLDRFGCLPAKYEGRVKPLETLARNTLRLISGRETYLATDESAAPKDSPGKDDSLPKTTQPAIRWLLDVVSHAPTPDGKSDRALDDRVFRIDHPETLALLGLEERPERLYAIAEFRDKIPELGKELDQIEKLPPERLTPHRQQLRDLGKKLRLYQTIVTAFDEPSLGELRSPDAMMAALGRIEEINKSLPPLAVPPSASGDAWQPLFTSLLHNEVVQLGGFRANDANPAAQFLKTLFRDFHGHQINPAANYLAAILAAYRDRDAAAFDARLGNYESWLASEKPADFHPFALEFEWFFDRFAPFYDAAVLYLMAFGIAVAAWLGWSRPLGLRRGRTDSPGACGAYLRALRSHLYFGPAAGDESL